MNRNNKKILAEEIKQKLNSPKYVAMPDLITFGDRHGKMLNFVFGWLVHGNVHSEDKDNFISDMSREKGDRMIYEHQFEPQDWEEIVNLIEKRNNEKQQIWETKLKKIEEKLNQQSNLYYYWGKGNLRKNERADGWHEGKGMRGFATFLGGNVNGLTHHLYIAEEHSVLDSFSFQAGFYLIDNDKSVKKCVGHYEGGFGCSGGETDPNNWKKYVEASDQITITPVEIANKPLEKPSQNKTGENNQIAGGKNNNLNGPTKKLPDKSEKKITDWLIQYFQENNVKEISLENGELVITNNNNNEIRTQEQINNEPELKNIQNWLQINGKQHLNRQDLNITNSPQSSTPNSPKYTPYVVWGAIGIGITSLVVIGYYLGKKRSKKNIE